MKKLINIFLFFIFLNSSITATAQNQAVSFQVFYDDLSPYGTWYQNPNYGYVWKPNLNAGFSPYSTNGYWTYTDAGWAWVSDYDWGWAPFHYGRWYYDSFYGYVWIPDYNWGPGWVTWRSSNDYYGWAPMGPGSYQVPYNNWRFVRCNDFGRRNINNYYINTTNNTTIINNTTVINNTIVDRNRNTKYNAGPDKIQVEKKLGKPINTVVIKDETKPAQKINEKELQLYRPIIEKNSGATTKPVPEKVGNLNDVKSEQKNEIAQPRPKMDAMTVPPKELSNQPIKQQPVQERPIKQLPIKEENKKQPVKQQPLQVSPVRQQPIREQNNNQPVKQEPVPERPVRQVPIREQNNPVTPRNQNANPQPVKQPPVQLQKIRRD